MNDSHSERYGNRNDVEALVEHAVHLLPIIGTSLYSGISHLGHSYQLTTTQVKVLLHLGAKGEMTVGEIANALGVSMPAASELVDRLVEAGHLSRTSDPADRRKVVVVATPEAKRIGIALRQLRQDQVRLALDQIAPEERPCFVRSLEALVYGLTQGHPSAAGCAASPPDRQEATTLRIVEQTS